MVTKLLTVSFFPGGHVPQLAQLKLSWFCVPGDGSPLLHLLSISDSISKASTQGLAESDSLGKLPEQ